MVARHPELEALISANPDDVDSWLVYAHWLSTQGDPLGEAISANASLLKERDARNGTPDNDRIAALARARIEIQARLEAELRQVAVGLYRGQAAVNCTWRTGRIAQLVASLDANATTAAGPLTALLGHPYCRFLETLKLEAAAPRSAAAGGPIQSLTWVVEAIARSAFADTLRVIAFTVDDRTASVDASPLARALPRLKSISVSATEVHLSGAFETLESIVLHGRSVSVSGTFPRTRSLTVPPLRAPMWSWKDAALPALEQLTLDARPVQGTSVDLMSLQGTFPAAPDLTIQDASDRLIEEFFGAPFPPGLLKLRLPGLGRHSPQVLQRNLERLRQLSELDLRANSGVSSELSSLRNALGSRVLLDRS
jgi:uncharacterized protein (TIGR02996 family)